MLGVVGEQPALEVLVHHGSRNGEVQCRRTGLREWLRIQLRLDCRRIIDNLQARTAGERAEIARMLRPRWMVQKLALVPFNDSIDVVDAKLPLVDQQSVR